MFREGGREGRTAARYCYSEGTFYFVAKSCEYCPKFTEAESL
jgi:hypothetical protein